MRTRFFILLVATFMLRVSRVHGQTDHVLHVKTFPGSTVGAKVSEAMRACSSDVHVPCVLVLDASLASYPLGIIPELCAQCSLQDDRTSNVGLFGAQSDGTNGVRLQQLNRVLDAASFAGATADMQMNACRAALTAAGGGTCDARGYGATVQTLAATVNLGDNLHYITWIFDPATVFQPARGASTLTLFNAAFQYLTLGDGLHVDTRNVTGYNGHVLSVVPKSPLLKWPRVLGAHITNAYALKGGATCLYIYADRNSNHWIQQAEFNLTCIGGAEDVHAETAVSGWINNNTFRIWDFSTGHTFRIVSNSLISEGGQFSSNRVWINEEAFYPLTNDRASVQDVIRFEGIAGSQAVENVFEVYAEDIEPGQPAAVNASLGSVKRNLIQGLLYLSYATGKPENTFDLSNEFVDLGQDYRSLAGPLGIGTRSPSAPLDVTRIGDGEAINLHYPGSVSLGFSCYGGTCYAGSAVNANEVLGATSPGKTAQIWGGGKVAGTANSDGSFGVAGGTKILYRCTTAGAVLPVGALTINAAACGATEDTGLRVK